MFADTIKLFREIRDIYDVLRALAKTQRALAKTQQALAKTQKSIINLNEDAIEDIKKINKRLDRIEIQSRLRGY